VMRFIPAVVSRATGSVTVRLPHGIAVETVDLTAVPVEWLAELIRTWEGRA
jgi:hypothetical protein